MADTPAASPPAVHLPAASRGEGPRTGRLAGHVIIVVGAGQDDRGLPPDPDLMGNGRATSITLADQGATVVCADRVLERAQRTAELAAERGGAAIAVALDASDEGAVEALFADVVANHGRLDGVVANVGVGGPAWLAGTTAEQWDQGFAINTRSHFLACKYGIASLAPGGSIVLVSSIAGLRPGSRIPMYDSSKAALAGLMRHAAMEGQRRLVRVNIVAPGLIDTPIGREATRGRPSRTAGSLPLGRQGTAWEVANAILFLLSDDAAYITGQLLAVDGGRSVL